MVEMVWEVGWGTLDDTGLQHNMDDLKHNNKTHYNVSLTWILFKYNRTHGHTRRQILMKQQLVQTDTRRFYKQKLVHMVKVWAKSQRTDSQGRSKFVCDNRDRKLITVAVDQDQYKNWKYKPDLKLTLKFHDFHSLPFNIVTNKHHTSCCQLFNYRWIHL